MWLGTIGLVDAARVHPVVRVSNNQGLVSCFLTVGTILATRYCEV
jgi:hypothetical protein